jgi:Protein of unknown function (DUF1588)
MKLPCVVLLMLGAFVAHAKPPAGAVFCTTYPASPLCQGQRPACTTCHTDAPTRNVFGAAVAASLAPAAARPLSDGDFSMALPAALRAVESGDADGDGKTNLQEIERGTFPGDVNSVFRDVTCDESGNPDFSVCRYDSRYVFRKMRLDFCGKSPTFEEIAAFDALPSETEKKTFIDTELDRCLATEFWLGKNGQLWRLAHTKVRPVGSLKQGEDLGQIPLGDYYDDYALFAYSQILDHDAREVLTGDYYVQRMKNPTSYVKVANRTNQKVPVERRAGVATTQWTLSYFVMFTALPRNAASQIYRSYLGLDIAKQEGLFSVPSEPRDFDNKGVASPACAVCHATLDPLSYAFRNYNGLGLPRATYLPDRIETRFADQGPNITQIPEAGFIFNQPVANLKEWAAVAANSDAFAISSVTDYWKFLFGRLPIASEQQEFVQIWKKFKTTHNWRVQKMLHDVVKSEAYGVP